MADNKINAKVEHLDTDAMNEASQALDKAMEDYKAEKDVIKTVIESTFNHWEGEGKDAFKKDYLLLTKQLDDLLDVLIDLRKGLVDAEETFINADAEISKSIAVAAAG